MRTYICVVYTGRSCPKTRTSAQLVLVGLRALLVLEIDDRREDVAGCVSHLALFCDATSRGRVVIRAPLLIRDANRPPVTRRPLFHRDPCVFLAHRFPRGLDVVHVLLLQAPRHRQVLRSGVRVHARRDLVMVCWCGPVSLGRRGGEGASLSVVAWLRAHHEARTASVCEGEGGRRGLKTLLGVV